MRTLQDYRDIFREISNNLGFQGDSVELLVQFLSEASYIGEVENVAYVNESSLDRSVLINSKIQHCIEFMYSVFRGSCPRVILNICPSKYFSLSMYDELCISNNFRVYYLGYWDPKSASGDGTLFDGFVEGPLTLSPSSEPHPILGLLAKETVSKSDRLTEDNLFYVDCPESDLSNDFWVKVGGGYVSNTRQFSDHILNDSVFDLTLPSFGSRLYVPESKRESNTQVEALYYRYSTLDSYNQNEIKKLSVRGADIISFPSVAPSWVGEDAGKWKFSDSSSYCIAPGILAIPEGKRDDLSSIHYKANRDRYMNSILRSNSDIGTLLEEEYPEKIYKGGTSYSFISNPGTGSSRCDLYYIPKLLSDLLTTSEKNDFIQKRRAYYVGTDSLKIYEGIRYVANMTIDVVLYRADTDNELDETIKSDIIPNYSRRFGMDLDEEKPSIESLISKVSNVRKISNLTITYMDEVGNVIQPDPVTGKLGGIDYDISYFDIEYNLNTVIQSIDV